MNKQPIALWVKTQFVGFHLWSAAPEQVHYLRDLHRHLFGVRVRVMVTDSDREVEFHMLKADVNAAIQNDLLINLRNCPGMSCEMMATHLGNVLRSQYNYPVSAVQVDEDGECGAEVYFKT